MNEWKLELIFPHVFHEVVPQSELVIALLISSTQLESHRYDNQLVHGLSRLRALTNVG